MKLGDLSQRFINNLSLRDEANTSHFIATMLSLGRIFQCSAAGSSSSTEVPSSLNEKKVLLWIAKSGTTIKISISNYSAQSVGSYSINRPTGELYLETADLIFIRLMYTPQFYDFDRLAFHKILIQEKLNGIYYPVNSLN